MVEKENSYKGLKNDLCNNHFSEHLIFQNIDTNSIKFHHHGTFIEFKAFEARYMKNLILKVLYLDKSFIEDKKLILVAFSYKNNTKPNMKANLE